MLVIIVFYASSIYFNGWTSLPNPGPLSSAAPGRPSVIVSDPEFPSFRECSNCKSELAVPETKEHEKGERMLEKYNLWAVSWKPKGAADEIHIPSLKSLKERLRASLSFSTFLRPFTLYARLLWRFFSVLLPFQHLFWDSACVLSLVV